MLETAIKEFHLSKMLDKRKAERDQILFPKKKKLIQMGQGWLPVAELRSRIRELEKNPFSGISIRLKRDDIFSPKAWDEEEFLEEYENISSIEWGRFTDNFIWTVCNAPLDFFNEDHWQNVLHNTRICARAALLGRCAGIVFDPEDYGKPVFSYPKSLHFGKKSFEKHEERLRECGEEWIKTIEEILPNPRIFDLWLSGFCIYGHERELWNGIMTPEQANAALPQHPYGLLKAFVNGMLKGAGPNTLIIDGNEYSYWYETSKEYLSFAKYSKELLPQVYIDPELHQKYALQVQTGSSYYPGFCYANYWGSPAYVMSDDEKAKWMEHNIYWSLKTTDEYAWEWGPGKKWWDNTISLSHAHAVRSARKKIEKNLDLGYETKPLFEDVFKRISENRTNGELNKLSENDPLPSISSKDDDPAWKNIKPLSGFSPFLDVPHKVFMPTQTKVLYDAYHFYAVFNCEESQTEKIEGKGKELYHSGFLADDYIEILIATQKSFPVYRFMINAKGMVWTAVCRSSQNLADTSYRPEWKYAACINKLSWKAEIAIPWDSVNRSTPKKGELLTVNFSRHRSQAGERTCWSPSFRWENMYPRFEKSVINPETFGILIFK